MIDRQKPSAAEQLIAFGLTGAGVRTAFFAGQLFDGPAGWS